MKRDVCLITLVGLIVLVPTLIIPVGPDQCALACTARRMLRSGALYFDIWNMYPASSALYTVILTLHDSPFTIRAFDVMWQIATATALTLLAKRVFDRAVALATGAAYLLAYVETGFWSYAQTDAMLNLPLVLALLCWLRSAQSGRLSWSVAGGFCAGVGLLFRFTLFPFFLCLPIIYGIGVEKQSEPASFRRILTTSFVGTALAIASMGAFLWMKGNTLEVIVPFWTGSVASYAQQGTESLPEALKLGVQSATGVLLVATNPFVALCALIGTVCAVRRVRTDMRLRLPLVYALAMLLSVIALRKFSTYYWLAMFPAWSLLAGCVVEVRRDMESIPAPRRRRLVFAAGVSLVVISISLNLERMHDFVSYLHSPRASAYLRKFHTDPPFIEFSAAAESAAARYVSRLADPPPALFVWGYAPMVQYLSGLDTPTRFMYQERVMASGVPRSWVEEFSADVMQALPPFIMIRRSTNPRIGSAAEDALPELRDFVRQRYYLDRNFGYLYVYRLKH